MDKYQEYLLKKLGFILCSTQELDDIPQAIRSQNKSVEFKKDEGVLILKQYADITITNYALLLGKCVIESLAKLFVFKNNIWEEIIPQSIDAKHSFGSTFGFDDPQAYIVLIDFNNKEISKLKIVFRNNLADDYTIELRYKEADRQAYYAKKEQERKDNLLKTANIKVSTGADLVNIYFQPCCSDYEYTEIYLYIPQDYATSWGGVKKPSSWQLFKKCKVPAEDFYKSINGLAYGTYAYVIKQFDKKDNLLLETDHIQFDISKPVIRNTGGKPNIGLNGPIR